MVLYWFVVAKRKSIGLTLFFFCAGSKENKTMVLQWSCKGPTKKLWFYSRVQQKSTTYARAHYRAHQSNSKAAGHSFPYSSHAARIRDALSSHHRAASLSPPRLKAGLRTSTGSVRARQRARFEVRRRLRALTRATSRHAARLIVTGSSHAPQLPRIARSPTTKMSFLTHLLLLRIQCT